MTDALRAVIADDEPLARRRMRMLLERDREVAVVCECADGESTAWALRDHRPELVFLDIEMPCRDGMAVLESLPPDARPQSVLVTAHERYAVRAFDVRAVDYLLKPYDDDRFATALDRAKAAARQRAIPRQLAVPGPRGTSLVAVTAIEWIEAADNYVQIHAAGTSHLLRSTLGELEQRLAGADLVRIHRRYLVRVRAIRRLERTAGGDLQVVLASGAQLPVGRSYRAALEAHVT